MVGPIPGPMLGSWLTENANWRWVFFINLYSLMRNIGSSAGISIVQAMIAYVGDFQIMMWVTLLLIRPAQKEPSGSA
jgi:MFS family permease